jgi:hypothetical protein
MVLMNHPGSDDSFELASPEFGDNVDIFEMLAGFSDEHKSLRLDDSPRGKLKMFAVRSRGVQADERTVFELETVVPTHKLSTSIDVP